MIKIKNNSKITVETLIKLSSIFNFDNIDITYFENILEFYCNKKILAMINYCFIPTIDGNMRLFIRNLYYIDKNDLDKIIKALCEYCKKNKLSIKTTLYNNKFDNDCIKILYDNNFKGGNDVLYYIL
jgi:hypothetical protein